MAGRQHGGAEFARSRQQIAEFDRLVALDAGHRGFSRDIAFRKAVDNRFLETLFVIEDVMRNTDPRGHRPGIVDIAAGAARALAMGRRAMIVKLQGDADDIVTGLRQQRRGHR